MVLNTAITEKNGFVIGKVTMTVPEKVFKTKLGISRVPRRSWVETVVYDTFFRDVNEQVAAKERNGESPDKVLRDAYAKRREFYKTENEKGRKK